jgi:hypothetical protein
MSQCPTQLLPLIGHQLKPYLVALYLATPSVKGEPRRVGNCRIREFEGLVETLTGTRVRSAASETKATGMQHFGEEDRPFLDMVYNLCHPSRPVGESRPEMRSLLNYLEVLRKSRGAAVAQFLGAELMDVSLEGAERRLNRGLERRIVRRMGSSHM